MRRSARDLDRLRARWLLALAWSVSLRRPGPPSVIRDAETESPDPPDRRSDLHRGRGSTPNSIDIYILNDDKLNAFVAGGQNLFINTGLILSAERPGRAGRRDRARDRPHRRRPSQPRRAGAAACRHPEHRRHAAGRGRRRGRRAAARHGASWPAAPPSAQRSLLKFSRTQEQAADQAAVTYLARCRCRREGLLDFFHVLETQNLRISADGSEFLRTHPLTRDRIAFLEQQVAESPYKDRRPEPRARRRL